MHHFCVQGKHINASHISLKVSMSIVCIIVNQSSLLSDFEEEVHNFHQIAPSVPTTTTAMVQLSKSQRAYTTFANRFVVVRAPPHNIMEEREPCLCVCVFLNILFFCIKGNREAAGLNSRPRHFQSFGSIEKQCASP